MYDLQTTNYSPLRKVNSLKFYYFQASLLNYHFHITKRKLFNSSLYQCKKWYMWSTYANVFVYTVDSG